MSTQATIPAGRLPHLVIRPVSDDRFVVKDPLAGTYFKLGEQEHFLLMLLDGLRDEAAICAAFKTRFCEELAVDDLRGFVDMVDGRGLLQSEPGLPGILDRGKRPMPLATMTMTTISQQ